jgi:multidrug efflux pump subunit AcrB
LKGLPGVQLIVDQDKAGPPQGKPVNIEITGDDYNQLLAEAERMKSYIDGQGIYGIEDLKPDVEMGKPELIIHIDRAKARRLNLSSSQIGTTLRTALFGKEISTYKEGEDDYDIVVRLQDKDRYSIETLLNQKITFRDQTNGKISQVPMSSVVTAEKKITFSAVKRRDLLRVISLQSNVLNDANATEVVESIKASLSSYEMPSGINWKFTGEQEEMAKNMKFLTNALLIAIGLIYLIIVSQFNKVSSPIIIVLSVLFSIIGVLFGLVIFKMDFVVIMTMIGIISLAGIVVNNAIVLIDYTDLIRIRKRLELGMADDQRLPMEETVKAIIAGGKIRLRPVLLTAITTILGLIPLAMGINIDFFSLVTDFNPQFFMGGDNVIFWGPMSWTIIFGLTFATFLTLVIVPVMYLIVERIKWKVYGDKVKA